MMATRTTAVHYEDRCQERRNAASDDRNFTNRLRSWALTALVTGIVAALMAGIAYQGFAVSLAEQAEIAGEHVVNTAAFAATAGDYQLFSQRQGFCNLPLRLQRAYAVLYKAAYLERPTVAVNGLDGEEVSSLMYAVWYDSPELFYVDPAVSVRTVTTSTLSKHAVSTVSFTYRYGLDELPAVRQDYETRLADATASFVGMQSDANKVNAINDWIIGHVSYDLESARTATDVAAWVAEGEGELAESQDGLLPEAATAYGALTRGEAMCGGYSQLFCAMCRRLGVSCQTIIGSADGYDAAHAWNAVKLAGAWRYVDVTWNDGCGDEHAYFLDAEQVFAESGHQAFDCNMPPLD